MSIQINVHISQPHFLYLSLILIYPPVSNLSLFYPPLSLSISCLSNFTYISFNPLLLISAYLSYTDLYLFLSFCQSKFTAISFKPVFFISLYFLYIHLYLFLSLVYSPVSLFISCLFTSISLYLFVNPNSRLYLSTPFSLSQPNSHLPTCIKFISFLSTTISFYLLFIQLYIYLFQSLAIFFSLFQYIPHIFTFITFYLLLITLYYY